MSDRRREAQALARAGYTVEAVTQLRDRAKARGDRVAARQWQKMRVALAGLDAARRAAEARARREESESGQVSLLGEERE